MPILNILNQMLKNGGSHITILQNNQKMIDWDEFRQHIISWQVALKSRPEKKWALYTQDTGIFLAALIGAWCANKTVYLPSDALPATHLALGSLVDGFLGDFDDADIRQVSLTNFELACEIPDNATTVFFTSGSTGQPKPIVKTIHQLMTELEALQQQFGETLKNATIFASVSHQHFYGFIFRALLPLVTKQVISNNIIDYPEKLSALPKQPYVLITSPAFLSRITQHSDWSHTQYYLRAVFSAGGELKNEHAQQVTSLCGQTPIEIYGSTETGAVAYRVNEPFFTPLPKVKIELNRSGLLSITCPYLEQPNVPFETQDIADIKENGLFSLQGRADRIVKIEEKRISLTQIEQLINSDARIIQCHVIAFTIKQRLILGVVAQLTSDGQLELARLGRRQFIESLKQPLKTSIEHLAIPKRWRFVDAIPLNPQGKIEFHTLHNFLKTPAPVIYPTITSVQIHTNEVILDFVVPADLLYFQGHFQRQAILPGVVQIDWVQHFARKFFTLDLTAQHHVKQVKQLKFQKSIAPFESITLRMSYVPEKLTLQFNYTSLGTQHSSGLMIWTRDE